MSRFEHDERGSAEAIGTIFSIVTLLMFAGLTLPALGLITDGAARSQEQELAYHSQRLSGEIQTVDQLVRRSASSGPIGRHIVLPDHVGNERYAISVISEPGGDQFLVLKTHSDEVSTRVRFVSDTPVANTTVVGGDLYVVRDDGASTITVLPDGGS